MLPKDRRLRPQDDGSYLVLIDGELIGRIYPFAHEPLPNYFKTSKQRQAAYKQRLDRGEWCAKLERSANRLSITFATSKMAAERLFDTWLHQELRQREIRTLDDDEITRLIELEGAIYHSISMSDAFGTAAKLEDFYSTYLAPLHSERRDRERRENWAEPG